MLGPQVLKTTVISIKVSILYWRGIAAIPYLNGGIGMFVLKIIPHHKIVRDALILILILVSTSFGYAKLEIIIKSEPDWGDMTDQEIEILCQNVVDHFEKHLRPENEIHDSVNVFRTDVGFNFLTLDISDPNVRYKIGIQPVRDGGIGYKITDFFYLIQPFTHEFCHLLQDQTRELFARDTQNLWLIEGIATMSSMWLMRELSKEWRNGSHFGINHHDPTNGALYNFSDSFNFWYNQWVNNTPRYQFDGTSSEWIKLHEDEMRMISLGNHGGDWGNNPPEQLAFRFLPVFENSPEAWNIITKMPVNNNRVDEYMQDWYDVVDIIDKQYVHDIAEIMEIEIETVGLIEEDIDVDRGEPLHINSMNKLTITWGELKRHR